MCSFAGRERERQVRSCQIMAMNVVIDMLKNGNKASYVYNGEGRKRRTAGFTMAEMLIVIAIIGVLAAVSFIAVQAHQKSMTQLQYDAIAKEIFVAAQNHLTLAKSENYGQASDLNTDTALNLTLDGKLYFGPDGNASADTVDDIRYFYSDDDNASTALERILPFGAVELVTGGKYIIRYQPNAARVLDVFYWTNDNKYGIDSIEYATAVDSYTGDEKKGDRAKIGGNGILGWCGGEGVVTTGEYLDAPEIEVINGGMLLVKVTDKNTSDSKKALTPLLKLIVQGDISGAKVAILLDSTKATYIKNGDRVEYNDNTFTVVLDDITTSGLHFSELLTKKPEGTLDNGIAFVPGENIIIQAVAYSNTVLTSVAYSGEWTTNSLFGEVEEDVVTNAGKTTKTAKSVHVSNIRHLANLNDSLSDVDYGNGYFESAVSAVQTVDLDWDTFKKEINQYKGVEENAAISIFDKTNAATKGDCFLPVTVSATYTLTYDGQYEVEIAKSGEDGTPVDPTKIKENHSIKGIVVDNTGDAPGTATVTPGGVFGSLTGGEIKNLELIDTKVTLESGNAGALAGTLTDTNVENIVAYHTEGKADTAKISTTSGSAGGLIGSIAGTASVSKSAASMIVESKNGDAGGLIGTSTSTGTVSGCYSGGHTIDDDGSGAVIYDPESYNVTAGGKAGGLIGDAGSTEISYSYSTCSVSGSAAGGFVGESKGSITSSYCTGLVGTTKGEDGQPASGASAGAFAAVCTGTTKDCHYYEIINEYGDDTKGYDYLTAIPKVGEGDGTKEGIDALDKDVESYRAFTEASSDAVPYNGVTLKKYYGQGSAEDYVAFNLKTVAKLDEDNKVKVQEEERDDDGNVTTPGDFVARHYGDWPAPEIFVVNT